MPVNLSIPAKDLSVDQLMEIFHLFCEAYGFEVDKNDIRYLRGQGIEKLNVGSTMDYRPFMGAKFFAVGNYKQTQFWGYTPSIPQLKGEEKFRKLVMEYLSK